MGRGILLWLLGVPIPIIILIALLYRRRRAALARKPQPKPARKTGVYGNANERSLSLLIGAFSASYMATVGGRVRDDLPMAG